MSIELHIEELVLHGFDPRDRHAIAEAVQQELARLVAERGLDALRTSSEVPRLDAGTIDLTTTRGAAAGAPIAQALHSTFLGSSGSSVPGGSSATGTTRGTEAPRGTEALRGTEEPGPLKR